MVIGVSKGAKAPLFFQPSVAGRDARNFDLFVHFSQILPKYFVHFAT
jgi:hypothetical protein